MQTASYMLTMCTLTCLHIQGAQHIDHTQKNPPSNMSGNSKSLYHESIRFIKGALTTTPHNTHGPSCQQACVVALKIACKQVLQAEATFFTQNRRYRDQDTANVANYFYYQANTIAPMVGLTSDEPTEFSQQRKRQFDAYCDKKQWHRLKEHATALESYVFSLAVFK